MQKKTPTLKRLKRPKKKRGFAGGDGHRRLTPWFLGLRRGHRLRRVSLSVQLHVLPQLRVGGKRLHAPLAPRLLPGMAALVPRQLRRALELELADVAGVGPFARVYALVQLSLAEGEERLLAVLTGEGPLPRVDEVVPG